jgi:hypothetical protein
MRSITLFAVASSLLGCSEADLPGLYWDVELSMQADNCNAPAVGYSEELSYRIEVDVEQASVAIGSDVFAQGSISGCTLSYESVAWTETRDAGDVRWQLTGTAATQRGDGACGNAVDWLGTETFTVLSSEDPLIRPGCEYVVDVVGTYVGEVEE